jgi:hypothetical protein
MERKELRGFREFRGKLDHKALRAIRAHRECLVIKER